MQGEVLLDIIIFHFLVKHGECDSRKITLAHQLIEKLIIGQVFVERLRRHVSLSKVDLR